MQHYCEHCRKTVEARRSPFSNALICSICGSEFGSGILASGSIVSGFRIEEEIGRGSFGVVYKAMQLNLERLVALKILSDELAQDSDFVDNFFREARLAASLSHPNIVQAFDAGATPEGIYYFAMELIEGETLESRIHRVGRMEPEAAVEVALKIARALEYAWDRQKLTHGDIKPENIILNSSGEAKLADLGLAKTAYEERSGHLMVTPLYAPPEVISGVDDFDPVRADIYSFGATFYHMLGGVPPFNEDDPDKVMEMHLSEIPESLAARFQVNSELSFITDRMLSKNPDERPLTWREIIELLEAVDLALPSLSKSTRRTPLSSRRKESKIQRKYLFVIGAAAIALLLAVVGFMLYQYNEVAASKRHQENMAARDSEWNKLKTDIKFLNEQKALEMVRKYVAEHKEDVPIDAFRTLNSLERDSIQAQKRKAMVAEFDTELAELKKLLDKPELAAYSSGDLLRIQARLINMLKKISENKFIYDRMAPKDKSFLDDKVKALKEALVVQKHLELKKQSAELDNRHRGKQNQQRESVKQLRIVNTEINNFRMALARFAAMPERQRNAVSYGQLFGSISRKDLPEHIYKLQDFLKNIYEINKNIYGTMASCRDNFVGQTFTQSDELQGFTIPDIDKNNMMLERKLDYGALKKKLPLRQFKNAVRIKLVRDFICTRENLPKLGNEDINVILRYFLDSGDHEAFNNTLKQLNGLSESDAKMWAELATAFREAAEEAAMIKLWNRAIQQKDQKSYSEAYDTLGQICFNGKNTEMYKRFEPEIEQLRDLLWIAAPELRLREMLDHAEAAMHKKDYFSALQDIMSACGRYNECPEIRPAMKERLKNQRSAIIQLLAAQTNENSASDMSTLYWRNLMPGSIWLFNRMVKNNQWLPSNPPTSSSLDVSSAWDIGDWDAIAAGLAEADKNLDNGFTIANSRFSSWKNPLLFYCILAAERRGNNIAVDKCRKILQDNTSGSPMPGNFMKLSFIAESYLRTRQFAEAEKVIGGVTGKDRNAESCQAGLLELYVMLQKADIPAKNFSAQVRSFMQIYGNNPRDFNDMEWVTLAEKIIKGTFIYTDLDQVKDRPGNSPELCARLVTDAAIYAYMNDKFPENGIKYLAEINDKLLNGNAGSTELWRKNISLKLAGTKNAEEFSQVMSQVVGDPRLCATVEYPTALMWKLAAMSVNTDDKELAAERLYAIAIKSGRIASENEKNVFAEITGKDPREFIRKLLAENHYNRMMPSVITAIWLNYYNNAMVRDLIQLTRENDRYLSWDERLLLKKIEQVTGE